MALFFRLCDEEDELTLREFLMRRYGAVYAEILSLPIPELSKFIDKARQIERREFIRRDYSQLIPYFELGHIQPLEFEDYYNARTGRNIDMRPADVIIQEIKDLHQKRGETIGDI